MFSFSSFKFVFVMITLLISYTLATRRLRIRQEANILIPTPSNFNLVYNNTASSYQTVGVRSYDATFTLDAALNDCFNFCQSTATCKMIFFYHCNQCSLTFCDWYVLSRNLY